MGCLRLRWIEIKTNQRLHIINTSILTLLPITFGVINYDNLPNYLVVNINLYTLSKPFVLILIPVIFTVISLFLNTMSSKTGNDKKYIIFSSQNTWVYPLVSNIFLIVIISNTLNLHSPLYFSILFLLGLIVNFLGTNMITNEYSKVTKYFSKYNIRESKIKRIGYIFILGSYFFIIVTYLNINIILLLSIFVFIVLLLPILLNHK